MSTKDLIASNKDPKTKKVFKEAELVIQRITQLHLKNKEKLQKPLKKQDI